MDADERLTALKKAYADIILNTAKEAAARIMVSERKALRFEYELKNAKEDALQMLLRLKQMMDSKVNEAAVASCTQQKKIEELEAQLQEAEDIVKDLREELRAVEAELERFPRSKQVKHPVQVDNASIPEPPPSEVQPNSKSQRLYNSLFPLKKSLISNRDLPSIILRSKETELYRNGCTQRIRACERTPPEIDDTKPESIIVKEDEVVDKLHITPSVEEKEVIKEMDVTAGNSCLTSPSSVKHLEENSDKDLVRTCNGESRITEKDGTMQQKNTEMEVEPPLKSSETKIPSQPLTDRVIKYTFQRKRKRGALINGSGSSERSDEGSGKANLKGESIQHQQVALTQLEEERLLKLEKERYLSCFMPKKNGGDITTDGGIKDNLTIIKGL
ncbi:unnamed protein product [Lactuca saligna]|uniref:Uncharacterized protein n=1 Tax=Lactuca saligna TaxID=75948 RepID=A0AA35YU73_LACSI|nr:unnamed protein product [Lactuca saligna]